jgi:putative nucleotidyltransferase with HDIG domain
LDRPSESQANLVKPEQLCPGLHIHLDLPWTEYPFSFPSFTISSADQVATLRCLGLKKIRYSPAKSVSPPLPDPVLDSPEAGAAKPPAPPAPGADDAPYQIKAARIKRLAEQQATIAAGEREFIALTRQMKALRQNLFSQPERICELATEAVARLADSTLVDAERSIHLMSGKVDGGNILSHALNVALLSMMAGKEMQFSAEQIKLLGLGGLFHDLGQAEIPEAIKNKTEAWTPAEAAMMRKHCAWGVALGKRLGLPAEVLLIIAQHHEHVDGSGYPGRLASAQLSPLSCIVAVAEAYDQLCNPKNPARACTPHEALAIIYAQKAKHFDEAAITAFVRCLSVYPPGTLVRLSNDTFALVICASSAQPLKPTLLLYDPEVANNEVIVIVLESEPDVTISKTLRPQELPIEASRYFLANRLTSGNLDLETG